MNGPSASTDIVPQAPFAAFERALGLQRSGQLDEAASAYEQAIAERPDHFPSLVNAAVVLRSLGKLEASLRLLYKALEIDPRQPGMWQNLGETLRRLKRLDEAVGAFKKAAQDSRILLAAVSGLALALKEAGQLDEALSAMETLLVKEPGNAAAWAAFSDVLFDAGQEDASQLALERAIRLKPASAAHHLKMAFHKSQQGQYQTAEAIYRALLNQGAEGLASVHTGLAQALISQGRLEEAMDPIARAMALDANQTDSHLARARLHFLAGRLGPGWDDYEWRKRHIDFTPPHLPVPVWDGQPLAGRSILLLGEQGAGDTIQFLRYAPMLAAGGGKVFLATSPALAPLLKLIPSLADVVTDGKSLPKTDCYAHLLDLPALFKTDLSNIPASVPYLPVPSPDEALKIKAPRGARLKVGLAFAGNPRHRGDRLRSMAFSKLAPLFALQGAAFYSLQVGQELPADAKPYLDSGLLIDLAGRIGSFADTAALVSQLDLVISVDTALVHLAGAMGKPAWVLLPFSPDWRWLLTRQDSPWYPSLTLFRQARPNDWDGVVRHVFKALQEKLAENDILALPSAAKRDDKQPRFTMTLPRSLLKDPGAAFIVKRESQFGGYEYATRAFLDAHLAPGDVVLDIGAHWGVIALSCASRWPGQVRVLAVEADATNAARLNEWAAANGLAHMIETVVAGCADKPGQGRLEAGGNSSMGFSVAPDPKGALRLVSIDSLLAERPSLQGMRCFVKIDVEGLEPEVVAGMKGLLASGQVAAIILERGRGFDAGAPRKNFTRLLAGLTGQGFKLMRFANEQLGGPLIPFVDTEDLCNFIALSAGFEPLASYARAPVSQVVAPTQPERARQVGEAKAKRTTNLKSALTSDAGFWADPANLSWLAAERAAAAAPLLPQKGRILDLGAGLMLLKKHLAPGIDYLPCDLVPWTEATLPCDLNQGQFPDGTFDAVALLEVLEFLHDPGGVLAACRKASSSLALTYRLRGKDKIKERRALGWFNDFDEKQLRALLKEAGWRVDLLVPAAEAETTLILAKPLPE
ncbi:TPR repeat protein [Rhodospirillaceae bacterium LM-1]|nr:TPR repeat protein [Rhodospirillaceae bacterium LM-1]